jgi:hypothetical protein
MLETSDEEEGSTPESEDVDKLELASWISVEDDDDSMLEDCLSIKELSVVGT